MQRPSPHSNFFSSLKQLEKRLKLDDPSQREATPADSITRYTNLKESETPLQFLSNSSLAQESVGIVEASGNGVDEIELMMQLLGLLEGNREGSKRVGVDLGCDDAFYGKIVGVKGPKSEEEVERLEGWIEHFLDRGTGE
ncbi:hypothetical protein R3W88_005369 [Solanum pinnatisectum]|uniref:Uncharacterized protein n=1 Tax=Solanum pinnatisectum TaxID=50273 RepID=A0AAV9KCA6_9SOLN|nr:hypothetical protein R3W88_005369 [Solanum pinnatisectum]